jgi:NADPH:quinone reductase-like Zn-dependent oxidoreductase
MKAAVLRSPEDVPEYAEFPEPEASDGLQVVDLVAAGLHQLVRSRAHGKHYSSEGAYPLVPGVDAVARTADGALIYTGNVAPPHGTMAERMAVQGGFPLPAGSHDRAAHVAAGMNPGLSSWMPLKARQAETGELGTVAILGATGASGLLAVQNARDLGASRVIAIGRNESALEKARAHGAETARLTEESIRTALADEPPNLILDYIWGPPAETMFELLTHLNTPKDTSYIQIGALAGPNAALPAALLRSRRIKITGSGLGSVDMATIQRLMPEYLTRIADGHVDVPIHTYPLSDVTQAWTAKPEDNARIVLTA